MPEFLFLVLVQLSLFVLGVSVVTIFVAFFRRPSRWYGYIFAKLGIIGIVGVILYLVLPTRQVEASGRVYFYLSSVLLCGVGVLIVCRDILERTARKQVHQELHQHEEA